MNHQPPAVGQWRTVTIAGNEYLAHLQVEADVSAASGAFAAKWIAVLYREPNMSARYVRGESFTSMDDAIAAAASLLGDQPVPASAITTKMAQPDGFTAPKPFFREVPAEATTTKPVFDHSAVGPDGFYPAPTPEQEEQIAKALEHWDELEDAPEVSPVRAMYERLRREFDATPAVPDTGGGVRGDRYSFPDLPAEAFPDVPERVTLSGVDTHVHEFVNVVKGGVVVDNSCACGARPIDLLSEREVVDEPDGEGY